MRGLSSLTVRMLRRLIASSPPRMSSQSHTRNFLLTSTFTKKKSYLNLNPYNSCNRYLILSSFSKTGNPEIDMQVEIISEENIKPTVATPGHLRTYEVSSLDQLYPHIYFSFVYFYPNRYGNNVLKTSRSQVLKQSLSEILTKFYPLAGEVKETGHIDCNDNGVYYVEAKANNNLSDFLEDPNNKSIHKFLPVDPKCLELLSSKTYLAMIQLTEFECGGIAIGVQTSHKIIDGYSHATFLKAWAAEAQAEARGSTTCLEETIIPSFISPTIFPSNPAFPVDTTIVSLLPCLEHGKSVTKRFLFRSSSIINLKKKANAPTRVTAVTGLIFKCFVAASESTKPCSLSMFVNTRNKVSPSIPNYPIGNIISNASVIIQAPNEGLELDVIVGRLKNAIDEIDSDSIELMKGKEWSLKYVELIKKLVPDFNKFSYMFVTSLCNNELRKLDFGWGNPIWIGVGDADADGNPILARSNLVILMDTRSGKGIEAWVTLPKEIMYVLENDPELLAFASLNSSPLHSDE